MRSVAVAVMVVVGLGGRAAGQRSSTAAVVGASECVPRSASARDGARVAWKKLSNPIFALEHMTKDQTIRRVDGRWHLFYSERPSDGSAGTGHAVSANLRDWEVTGRFESTGSPDLTRADGGRYVITAQVRDAVNSEISRVRDRTATDPSGEWTPPARLTPGLFEEQRTIDGALAHTEHGLFLIFKRGLHTAVDQHDELAWSPSGSLDGPWEHLGEPDLPWSENFEFLPINGVWHVLVTTIPVHRPALFRLVGDPAKPRSWLHWKKVRELDIPAERWNRGEGMPGFTHETANSAYLCDARRLDGYWYLFYAGSTELTTHEGRGHAKIGIARSKDLKEWVVPPG